MSLDDAIRELRAKKMPVPMPARLATPAEVAAVERQLGVSFPADFRRYLLEASDVNYGILEPVTITVPDSHTDLLSVADSAWNGYGVPRDLLPICHDNGDFYCINSRSEIVFWSSDGCSSEKWPSLADWIEQVWLGEA